MLVEHRNCGIEIEFTCDEEKWENTLDAAIKKLRAIDNVNLWWAEDELKFSGAPPACNFHLTTDASVTDAGLELQTRPFQLRDKKYINTFRSAVQWIKCTNGYINDTCGLHIHIGALDFDLRNITNLVAFFLTWRLVLFSVISPGRLNNVNCRPIQRPFADYIVECTKLSDLELAWDRFTDRYTYLNLETWFEQRHYEIRMCHGLLNPQKMLNWANLQLHIAQHVKSLKGFTVLSIIEAPGSIAELQNMLELINFPEAISYFTNEYNNFNREV